MPTGYTSDIGSKDVSFEKFALKCARAFGACIMQRDNPLDELPALRKPENKYYTDRKRILEQEKEELLKLSDREFLEKERIKIVSHIEQYKAEMAKCEKLREKYNKILKKAQAWAPPSDDHTELKTFMIKQLNSSMEADCDISFYQEFITRAEGSLCSECIILTKSEKLAEIENEIKRCDKSIKEEEKRVESSNKWIKSLYNSLGMDI